MDGRLGDAVHVNKLWCFIAVPIEPRSQALHFEGFPAENDITESQFLLANRLFGLNQLAEGRWRLVQHRHPFGGEQFVERLR